jgi:hypothetical protein
MFNQAQDQGGAGWPTADIHCVFRGLATLPQHRDCAWGEVLKPPPLSIEVALLVNQRSAVICSEPDL